MSFMDKLALPPELTNRNQWIVWKTKMRDGDETKVPIDPHTLKYGSSTDPDTWASYEKADAVSSDSDEYHLGFVFTEDDPLIGVDIDKVRDPETGKTEDWAKEIIDRLNSYTEVSPSGTGYHVIVKGEMPDGRNRHNSLEMYDSGRFFTVSKDRVEGTEYNVKERTGSIKIIHHKFLKKDDDEEKNTGNKPDTVNKLEDKEIIKRAKASANGRKFEQLWNGNYSGYESQSEADLALCSYLAFWTGGDANQMDRLFRSSGLYRDKWDREHFSDGSTYGEKTIERAIETCGDFYGN